MRGFAAGSFALIVLWVVVQPGTADKASTGGNVLVSALKRALSAQVAGVPDRSHSGAVIVAPAPAPSPSKPGTIPV
jgi:hypothetical protein